MLLGVIRQRCEEDLDLRYLLLLRGERACVCVFAAVPAVRTNTGSFEGFLWLCWVASQSCRESTGRYIEVRRITMAKRQRARGHWSFDLEEEAAIQLPAKQHLGCSTNGRGLTLTHTL